ncbi:MAG: chorismate mutase [Clostridia bacterium]|nr:chorismate mutase [Clostridia bacterium]
MNIVEMREKIDSIDDQILKLFIERMNICKEVAQYKADRNMMILDTVREMEILTRVTGGIPMEYDDAVRSLFLTIMDHSRQVQAKITQK